MTETKDVKQEVAKPAEKVVSNAVVQQATNKLIALVKIRTSIGVDKDVIDTMNMLSLYDTNFCTVHKATPSAMGMIKKIKDYITWGEISEETLKELIKVRGKINPKDPEKTKKFFRLNSPKKGYGRKGIKVAFKLGGALGDRGDAINDLIKRML